MNNCELNIEIADETIELTLESFPVHTENTTIVEYDDTGLQNQLNTKADKTSVYTQTQTDNLLQNIDIDVINNLVDGGTDVALSAEQGKVLKGFIDNILEFSTLADFPTTGESGKLYIDLDTDFLYRWSGTTYVQISGGSDDTKANLTGGNTFSGDQVFNDNVGVGTTTPEELIHIQSNDPRIRFDDISSGIHYLIGQDGDSFRFSTNNPTFSKYLFNSHVVLDNNKYFRGRTSAGVETNLIGKDSNNRTIVGDSNDNVFNGKVKATGYKSSDGSEGVTTTFTNGDGDTVTVKNGLITDIS